MSEKIILKTPIVRLAYTYLVEPRQSTFKNADGSTQKPKYETCMIFPEDNSIEEIRKVVHKLLVKLKGQAETDRAFRDNAEGLASVLTLPFKKKSTYINKDGVRRVGFDGDGWVLRAHSNNPVPVLAKPAVGAVPVMIDPAEAYAGSYARAQICLATYDKGVTCYLNGVLKVRDGDKLGGGQVDFSDVDEVYAPAQAGFDFSDL